MRKLITIILVTTLAVLISFSLQASVSAYSSASSGIWAGIDAAHGDGQPYQLFGDGGVITSITNILLFIVGALTVVMVIWGGIRYALSGGNSAAVTAAKNTIMYALIGLVIAFLAFAIVNFVLAAITPGGGAGFTNV